METEEWGKRERRGDVATRRRGDLDLSPRLRVVLSPRLLVRALSQTLFVQRASLNSYTTVRGHRSHCGASRAETYGEFLCDATLDSNRKVNADASVDGSCLKVRRIILRDTHRNAAVSGAHI